MELYLLDYPTADQLRFRATDRRVHETVGRWPLSVSADRIALPAMRTFALLVRHGVTDRSDDNKFYEVYPAGSLSQWGLTSRGYKKNRPDHKEARETILAAYARRCRGWSCQMLAPRPGLGKPPANRNRVGLCGFGAVDEGAVFSLVILLSNRSYAARLLLFAT